MKNSTLFLILFIALTAISHAQIQCENDSTGLIPLNDLGNGYYETYQGGLYLGGSNTMPGSHKKKGNNYSKTMKPLDTLGNINYETGEILMLAFGASIASNAINAFGDSLITNNYEGVSNCITIKSMCFGGKDLDYMVNTSTAANYWCDVRNRMHDRGDAYNQVQIAWIMQQSDVDTTDNLMDYYTSVSNKYITLLQTLKDTFPNLKQVFISGMHYTGYMDPTHARYPAFSSPHDYWGNIVIRDIINRQINGDPALKYTGAAPQSAWIAWGPYFWADGINPRTTDGLSWSCDQFRSDPTGGGFHLVNEPYALGVEADMLETFFKTDPVAKTWYLNGALWASCPADTLREGRIIIPEQNTFLLFPNPATNTVVIKLSEVINSDFEITIFDALGKIIEHQTFSNYNAQTIPLQLHCDDGIYFVEINSSGAKMINELVVQH